MLAPVGTYLITGGLGSMGLAFAKYFGLQTRANLVLVGRSAVPAEENWDTYLEDHDTGGPQEATVRPRRRGGPAGQYFASLADDIARIKRMTSELAIADLHSYEGLEPSLHRLSSSQICEYLTGRGVDIAASGMYRCRGIKTTTGNPCHSSIASSNC